MKFISKSIIALLGATTIAGGVYGYKEHQHAQQWEKQQYRNAIYWIQMQSMYLNDFDYKLAEALAANSPDKRQEAIEGAIDDSNLIMRQLTNASATMNLLQLYWPSYESFATDSSRYLAYPASEQGPKLLADQLEQMDRMRKFARTAMPYLNQMKANGVTLPEIQQFADEMGAALSKLDGISIYGNKDFNEYQYKLNPYTPTKKGTVFVGEPTYKATELAAKAKTFMGNAWNKGPGKQSVHMKSGGFGSDFGEVMDFTLSDDTGKRTSPYTITLSKSGHVIRVTSGGKQSDTSGQSLDMQQAIELADEWMERWSDERLTLVTKLQTDSSIQLVYVPVREQVPIPQMRVVWRFDPNTGELIKFDATEYFRDYNKSFTLHPKLTAEQAAAALSPNLRSTGAPKLEIHEGKLTYKIPVTGIEGVKLVYINALTGSTDSIAYNS
ncbi:PepSY1/2 domain-containing protein [Paenibacillus glycanilyticus]|uniref:Germination protein YpeB n=1 Tax=Paenibacillus glycanilyticus TaxID=126569 RepID=A0ABQ6GEF3_9BACL|nr:PepSY1/2 domain-containing protein [Paenibacillus glycanilyticus]GLX68618.1 germination protein YpeB [Paenibacillus glycanilyticus]